MARRRPELASTRRRPVAVLPRAGLPVPSRPAGDTARQLKFYARALATTTSSISRTRTACTSGPSLQRVFSRFGESAEVKLLKRSGKKIVYSNNGCLDGVSQTSFSAWGDGRCATSAHGSTCRRSAATRRTWPGESCATASPTTRSPSAAIAPTTTTIPRVHEVPEFYCLDPLFWSPDLLIPTNYRLPLSSTTVKVYHSVGNFDVRTSSGGVNLKSTHVWVPVVDRLKSEGHDVEMIFFNDVPNKAVRYYQAQADVVVDMLTVGFFGANVREALMLGKPVICYLPTGMAREHEAGDPRVRRRDSRGQCDSGDGLRDAARPGREP